MVLYVDDASYLANSDFKDFKASYNTWTVHDIQDYSDVLKIIKDPLNTIIQYFFMTIYNGSNALLEQMLIIDTNFI